MTPPLISCITPVFNGRRFIGAMIESVLAQTHRPLELIIVDDGSTDRTAAIIQSYAQRHPEVRYLHQDNTGPPAARNLGVSAATGEFIAFLDSDDTWFPEKLTRQLARLVERPDIDLLMCHNELFW